MAPAPKQKEKKEKKKKKGRRVMGCGYYGQCIRGIGYGARGMVHRSQGLPGK